MDFQEKIKKTKNLKERIRLCAILAHINGHSVKAIAEILGISQSTVYDYIAEYEKNQRTEGKIYQGRSSKLNKTQETELIEYLKSNPCPTLKELSHYIAEKYQITYTLSGLRDWLNRKNLRKVKKKFSEE